MKKEKEKDRISYGNPNWKKIPFVKTESERL